MISMHIHNELDNFFIERGNDLHHDIVGEALRNKFIITF